MSETSPPLSPEEEIRKQAKKRAEDLRGFMQHLGSYLAVGLVLLFINLVTSPGSLWFFWPLLPWTVGIAIHGWNVLWNDRLFDDAWAERKAQEILANKQKSQSAPPSSSTATPASQGTIMPRAAALIDEMRTSARRIQKPEIRRQALAVSASADQVLSALTDNPEETVIARDFLDRYLAPASKIIGDYSRLSSRNIASAQPTLRKVEEHDLPLLHAKFDELYDRVHRGSLIDLQVAREMLSFDAADWNEEEIQSIDSGVRPGTRSTSS